MQFAPGMDSQTFYAPRFLRNFNLTQVTHGKIELFGDSDKGPEVQYKAYQSAMNNFNSSFSVNQPIRNDITISSFIQPDTGILLAQNSSTSHSYSYPTTCNLNDGGCYVLI